MLVESHCGEDTTTFTKTMTLTERRGIWGINTALIFLIKMYSRNTSLPADILDMFRNIKTRLQLDLSTMVGSSDEVDRPMHNAILMAVYLTFLPPIPKTIEGQALYWATYIKKDELMANEFLSRLRTMPIPKRPPVDLLISVDGSTQSDSADVIGGVKDGLRHIRNDTKFGQAATKLAIIEYSDEVRKPHTFAENQDSSSISQSEESIAFTGGEANHYKAVEEVEKEFNNSRPRKEGIPRVVVFVITKRSRNETKTCEAARKLDLKKWLHRYVIVVGEDPGLKMIPEVLCLASIPKCNHIFPGRNPFEIPDVIDEITEAAGEVQVPISDIYERNATIGCNLNSESRSFDDSIENKKGKKYKLEVTGGSTTLYFSRTEEEPNEDNNEYKATASDNSPAEFEVTAEDMQAASRGNDYSGVEKRRKRETSVETVFFLLSGSGSALLKSEETSESTTTTTSIPNGLPTGAASLKMFGYLVGVLALITAIFSTTSN